MAKPMVLLEVSRPICSLIAKSSPGPLVHPETEATFLRELTVDLYFCFSAGLSKVAISLELPLLEPAADGAAAVVLEEGYPPCVRPFRPSERRRLA